MPHSFCRNHGVREIMMTASTSTNASAPRLFCFRLLQKSQIIARSIPIKNTGTYQRNCTEFSVYVVNGKATDSTMPIPAITANSHFLSFMICCNSQNSGAIRKNFIITGIYQKCPYPSTSNKCRSSSFPSGINPSPMEINSTARYGIMIRMIFLT